MILFLIFIVFIFSTYAYYNDKRKDRIDNDDFKRGGLFLRYGKMIYSSLIPLTVDENRSGKSKIKLKQELKSFIAEKLNEEFVDDSHYSGKVLNIKDLKRIEDKRDFLKFSFITDRGSQIHNFLYFPVIGDQLILRHATYLRGNYYFFDVLKFILSSPFTILFWIRSWIRGEYSIINEISSNFDESSYDYLDSIAFFKTSIIITQQHVLAFAKENKLLSEEVEKIIIQNITNSQNIDIKGSSGISIGNLSIGSK